MRHRAGIVLIEDGKVVLIERHRAGLHYFTFPGGGVEDGETVEEAAIREMKEETGLSVEAIRKIAEIQFNGNPQSYFLAKRIGGEFGSGAGEEYGAYDPKHGTYHPLWMPVSEILTNNVLPREVAEIVLSQCVQ